MAASPLAPGLAGAALLCVYLGLWVDPAVFYEHGGYFPAFQRGSEFLAPFLLRPGGPSQYLAAALAQTCANRWLGALAFAGLALLLGWGYDRYLRQAAPRSARGWGALLSLGPVLVWTRYGFHLDSITALTLAVLGAAAYARPQVGSLAPRWRAGVALVALVLGYWVCGGAVYVAVLLVAAVEQQRRGQPRLAAMLLLWGILVPVVIGHLGLALPLRAAATCLLPYSDTARLEGGLSLGLLYGLALVPPLRLLLKRGELATPRRLGWARLTPRVRALTGALAVLALLVAARSPHTARRLVIMKHCRARAWERVLAQAAKLPAERFTLDVSYAVNLALYHTGNLGNSMFAFPQGPLSLTLGTAFASCSDRRYYSERPKAVFDIGLANLEMGLANEAEHVAHEALEIYGPHPTILKQLVLVNLVKGRPETAAVFLHALRLDLVARPWADATLATLARAPGELLDRGMVAGMRANLPARGDSTVPMLTLAERCLGQLEGNPGNRMALEYLLAQHLLNHDLAAFIRELPRLRDVPTTALPRHYQEAVLLYEAQTGGPVAEWSAQVRPESRERFKRFAAAVASAGGRADPAQAVAIAAPFAETYFYHYVFQRAE